MGTMIVIACVAAGINLALWGALYRRLGDVPWRVWSLARKDKTEGEAAALTLLQERTAAKVGVIVKSLREYEENVAAGFRAQVAEAQVRARVAERQASETGVALSAATTLVRELRAVVDGERRVHRLASPPAPEVSEERPTIEIERRDEGARLSGDDELTSVSSHRLPGMPGDAGPTLVSPANGRRGAR